MGKADKFHFFKLKWNIAQKSATHIVGANSGAKQIVVAKQYSDAWIVAVFAKSGGLAAGLAAPKKGKKKDKKDDKKKLTYSAPPLAYNAACKALFDDLDEEEE